MAGFQRLITMQPGDLGVEQYHQSYVDNYKESELTLDAYIMFHLGLFLAAFGSGILPIFCIRKNQQF